jgi:hypothetical protein
VFFMVCVCIYRFIMTYKDGVNLERNRAGIQEKKSIKYISFLSCNKI